MINSITTQDNITVQTTLERLLLARYDHNEDNAVGDFLKIYKDIDFSQINPKKLVVLLETLIEYSLTISRYDAELGFTNKQKAFRLFSINLDSCISIEDRTSKLNNPVGHTSYTGQQYYSFLKEKGYDSFLKEKGLEAFLAMDFTDRVDLESLPNYMPIIMGLLPSYLDRIFFEKDGSKNLKLEKEAYVTFDNLLKQANSYINFQVNDSLPKEINLVIKEKGNPGGFDFDFNKDAFEFHYVKKFLSNLSKHDVEMTDKFCNALLEYTPGVKERLAEEYGSALKQENEGEIKNNLNKAKGIISTLGFQRYRENQPLSNNVSTKPVIKEGRQRLETALESLIKERLLPEVLDLTLRERIINSFENMESSNFTVKEIKRHLVDQLHLQVPEKPTNKPKG